jgi:hypothetical protein
MARRLWPPRHQRQLRNASAAPALSGTPTKRAVEIPLARHAREVVAIDPVADMQARGRLAAQAARAGNVTWIEGDSSQIAALAAPGQIWPYSLRRFTDRPARRPGRPGRGAGTSSAFCAVDTLTWSWSRQLTVEEVTGLQLSYSFSTPALLGDKAPAFSRDVRAAVLAMHPAGAVTGPFRVEVLIATRP